MTEKLDALLKRLTPVARDHIVYVLGHSDTCIPTCRVLQAVLGHFEFQSFAVATEVNAYNRIYAEMVQSFGGHEPTAEQVKPWRDRGASSVRISPEMATAGVPIAGTDWDGHLVLRVEDIVLDGSIEMCSRPAKSILLPKLLGVAVDEKWDKGNEEASVTLLNGCGVTYKRLNDDSWQHSEYWTEPFEQRMRRIAEEIVSRLRTS